MSAHLKNRPTFMRLMAATLDMQTKQSILARKEIVEDFKAEVKLGMTYANQMYYILPGNVHVTMASIEEFHKNPNGYKDE